MLVIATTGMRSGEARALKWENFKEDYQVFEIIASIKGNNKYGDETKKGDSWAAYIPGRTFKLMQWWHSVTEFPGPEHFIFFGDAGGPRHLNTRALSLKLNKVLLDLEIPKGRQDVHAFRHTHDTMLKQRISNEALKYLLGHKSDRMLKRYDHTEELQRLGRYKDEMKKIDEIF